MNLFEFRFICFVCAEKYFSWKLYSKIFLSIMKYIKWIYYWIDYCVKFYRINFCDSALLRTEHLVDLCLQNDQTECEVRTKWCCGVHLFPATKSKSNH